MLKIAANTLKTKTKGFQKTSFTAFSEKGEPLFLTQKAKVLAWGLFLVFFIESDTLGLIPSNFYFVYRNVRISDILIYALTIYSFYSIKEFAQLYRSKAVTILKLMLGYFLFEFIVSCILYDYNVLEYFFRLKSMWSSFLVFPFLLLLNRGGFKYLAKLALPVAVVSNVLYILSAVTGMAFLPGIGIEKQSLPGGMEVFRVFGGTFYGELFFLGFIYMWITDKFRVYQLFLVILFIIPHILAFGRSAWAYFTITIIIMFVWYSMKNRKMKTTARQVALVVVLGIAVIYAFIRFVPRSDYLTEAIQARISQGEDDIKYKEGTYGTRLASVDALIRLWLNNNVLFGVGMHPMWVVKPLTVEENLYAWGFSDVVWAGVLAAYGIIGFCFAAFFQIYYIVTSFKIIKRAKNYDIILFLVLIFFSKLIFDTLLNSSYTLFTSGLMGFSPSVLFLSAVIYKYEHPG